MADYDWERDARAMRRSRLGLVAAVVLYLLALVFVWFVESHAHARSTPIPPAEWTPGVHLELARCVVGESGWTSTADHDAIAWSLARAWARVAKNRDGWTFGAQIRAYCKGGHPRQRSRQWVRQLPAPGGEWPKAAGPHQRHWSRILRRLERWSNGEIPPRCRASHWGGMDLPTDRARAERAIGDGRWVIASCGRTRNTFFAVVNR